MNRLLIFVITIFSIGNLYAQQPDWENPAVIAVGKEEPRATSLPYPDEHLALADEYSASPWYQSLNGTWKFHWVPKPGIKPEGFYNEDFDVGLWDDIPVPGSWETHGYGITRYINYGYAFPINPPYVDHDDNPVGSYRRTFEIPRGWQGRRVYLHFEAGTAAMYVWVNGQKVGYTQNARTNAEFDITPYIRLGVNSLACEVYKYSDGSYLEDQDMWRMGGINRSVYLYSTDQMRIADFSARPVLDASYRNGTLHTDIEIRNYTSASQQVAVEMKLVDKKGRTVLARTAKVHVDAASQGSISLSGAVANPLKWTAETPNLYTLLLTLKDGTGKTIEVTSHRVGFRRIDIRDGQLYINGQKVYFKGVNLHEFNARTGQVTDRETMLRDIQLMKGLNINAVRTSHYPQPALWYRLCDEYGLYLVDEANIESHGAWYKGIYFSELPEWEAAHLERVRSMFERDKNHPSVIFWSMGNETGNGKTFHMLYNWLKKHDSGRPVMFNPAGNDSNTDIISPMYPRFWEMQRDAKVDLGRPYIMCEYAHAMGNSMGNFREYWELMRTSKNMQGGFIWEWLNHGLPNRDEQGRFYWAYGGDLGEYDKHHRENFCHDGIVSPDREYMPHSLIVKKVYQDILFRARDLRKGIITVVNDFRFKSLDDSYTYRWQLLRNGEPCAEGNFQLQVPPGSERDVSLPLPVTHDEGGTEYFLQVFAYLQKKDSNQLLPVGYEVARDEFAWNDNNYFETWDISGEAPRVDEGEDKITVTTGLLVYTFSRDNGKSLTGLTHNGEPIMKELPTLNFWRAPTDNDWGANMQHKLTLWYAAADNLRYGFNGLTRHDNAISLCYTATSPGMAFEINVTYTINPGGSLTIEPHYKALADDLPEMFRFGMRMILPSGTNNFSWYGRGPQENYVDRCDDAFMGIWHSTVDKQAYPYPRPQETGNKTDVRWLKLTDGGGKGIRISGAQPLSVSALNHRQEDFDPGKTKKQQHWSDVVARKEIVLCVDLFQRGLGGVDSWGTNPLDAYRFKQKNYSYSFTIELLK